MEQDTIITANVSLHSLCCWNISTGHVEIDTRYIFTGCGIGFVENEAVSVSPKNQVLWKKKRSLCTKKSGFVEKEAISVSPKNQVLWKMKRSLCHQTIRFCGKRSGLCVTKKSGFVEKEAVSVSPKNQVLWLKLRDFQHHRTEAVRY